MKKRSKIKGVETAIRGQLQEGAFSLFLITDDRRIIRVYIKCKWNKNYIGKRITALADVFRNANGNINRINIKEWIEVKSVTECRERS